MTFQDLAETLDAICIDTFGTTANFYPQSTPNTAIPIQGVFEKPAMLEDVLPGWGTSVVRFFIGFQSVNPSPQHGDILTINSSSYDINEVEVDAVGGATLKLRLRSNLSNKQSMPGVSRIAAV
jgi:hypothetical protein